MNTDHPRYSESAGTRKRVRLNSVDSVGPRPREYMPRNWLCMTGVIDTGTEARRRIECART
jgi:hypothetical protein